MRLLLGIVLASLSVAKPATLATFSRSWEGHDRLLTITRSGRGTELLLDGCCTRALDVVFQLSSPRGTTTSATATGKVVFVRVRDPGAFSKQYPPPHLGQVGTFRFSHGVLTEPLTGTDYCSLAARAGACGA